MFAHLCICDWSDIVICNSSLIYSSSSGLLMLLGWVTLYSLRDCLLFKPVSHKNYCCSVTKETLYFEQPLQTIHFHHLGKTEWVRTLSSSLILFNFFCSFSVIEFYRSTNPQRAATNTASSCKVPEKGKFRRILRYKKALNFCCRFLTERTMR